MRSGLYLIRWGWERARLKAAHAMLREGRSVTETCYACGFNNVSNFNRQFLAQKNMPPSRFRRYYRLNEDCEAVA